MAEVEPAQPIQPAFTEVEFMHGNPAQLVQATKTPRILAIWPHGDETLGPRVGYHIYSERPDLLANVDYVCGNPLAASEYPAIRHTKEIVEGFTASGTDLNRSFTPDIQPQSYEQHRAIELKRQIDERGYDYILDLHTTFTGGGRYFIIYEEFLAEKAVREAIAASPISRIVVLPEKIARDGLIGTYKQSVSIEYSRPLAGKTGVKDTLTLLDGLVAGQPLVSARPRELFYITDVIPKTKDPGLDAKNFQLCRDGYYPVLFGERGYRNDPTKHYLGFAAARRDVEVL